MLTGKTIVVTGISSGIGARVGELGVALGARTYALAKGTVYSRGR